MKAKSIYAVLASLMFTTGLVACGPETNPTGGNTGGSTTSSPTTQAPEVKKGTVVLSFDNNQGTVTADKTNGDVGQTVTLTITPNEGYEIDSVKANDKVLSGATYSFKLVEGENNVEVTFKAKAVEPEVEYNITYTASEDYDVKELSATKAKKGQTVTFKVEVKNENKELDEVKANGTALTANDGVYSFVMGEADAVIEVTLKDKAVEPEVEYNITYTASEDYTVTNLATKATKGTKVTFNIAINDENKELSSIKANDVDCTLEEDGSYSFVMPEGDVAIVITLQTKVNLNLSITSDKQSYKEGDGAAVLQATFGDNQVEGATYVWDGTDAKDIGVVNPFTDDESKQYFTPTNVGKGTVKVTATVDGKEYKASLNITVEADYTKYTEIKTADAMVELLNKKDAINGKYCLGANIDLGGMQVNGRANNSIFVGTIDGRGYTLSNFVVKNDSSQETDKATGLFWQYQGVLRNIHIKGTIDSAGFSGLLAKEVSGPQAKITDCLFEAKNVQTGVDWTWGRNGVIASTLQNEAKVENVVTNLDATDAMCMPFFAYSWSGTQVMKNAYTNIAHDTQNENYKPFNPNGGDISTQVMENINHTPFDFTLASAYTTLDSSVWTLEDNKMPVLTHDSEAPEKLEAMLTASADTTSLSMKEDGTKTATITTSLKYSTETLFDYSYTLDPSDASVISVTNNNDGTFGITAVAAGEATVSVSAKLGDKTLTAEAITFTVKSADAPKYEIPDGAFEIKDVATFKTVFDKGAAYTTRNFYLSNDIDLTGDELTTTQMMWMAGEFSGIFEGQGHTITGDISWDMFNIIAASGVVRNVNIKTSNPVEANRGPLAHTNKGTISNVHIDMTVVEKRATNTFAGMFFSNEGKVEDSSVAFHVNTASNTIKSFSNIGSGTYTNCTYTVDGTWDGAQNAVVATDGTTKKDA